LIAKRAPAPIYLREKILVEISPDELMLNITVRTELRGEQMSNLSWLVFAAVDSLVKEWYNLNVRSPLSLALPHNYSSRLTPSPSPFVQAKVLVPCSHCMTLDLKAAPFMFAIEKCQQAATSPNESILFCPNGTHCTPRLLALRAAQLTPATHQKRAVEIRSRCAWTTSPPTWPWCTWTGTGSTGPTSSSPTATISPWPKVNSPRARSP
jgi:hypothetical protein